jgi:pimeloyl-ACP methyl ester carboxylesterase
MLRCATHRFLVRATLRWLLSRPPAPSTLNPALVAPLLRGDSVVLPPVVLYAYASGLCRRAGSCRKPVAAAENSHDHGSNRRLMMPNARAVVLDQAGHMAHIDQPRGRLQAITDFLG